MHLEKRRILLLIVRRYSPHKPSGRRTRANFLFKSKDLVSWDYLHPFIEGDSFTRIGDDGACPYFWPIGEDRYILYFLVI